MPDLTMAEIEELVAFLRTRHASQQKAAEVIESLQRQLAAERQIVDMTHAELQYTLAQLAAERERAEKAEARIVALREANVMIETESGENLLRAEKAERERDEARATLKWVNEVYPGRLSANGARIEITWDEWNAMRQAAGYPPRKRIAGDEGRAGANHRLRAERDAIAAKLAEALKALELANGWMLETIPFEGSAARAQWLKDNAVVYAVLGRESPARALLESTKEGGGE